MAQRPKSVKIDPALVPHLETFCGLTGISQTHVISAGAALYLFSAGHVRDPINGLYAALVRDLASRSGVGVWEGGPINAATPRGARMSLELSSRDNNRAFARALSDQFALMAALLDGAAAVGTRPDPEPRQVPILSAAEQPHVTADITPRRSAAPRRRRKTGPT